MPNDELFGDDRLELSEMLSHILDKGVVLHGEVMLSVADIDLVRLDLGLLLSAFETTLEQKKKRRKHTRLMSTALGPPDFRSPEERQKAASEAAKAGAQAQNVQTQPVELGELAPRLPERINTDPEKVENGLARLVLTLIEVLRKVLEHQAIRRMEGGHLSDAEVERLGLALLRLNDRMQEMKGIFGLTDEDLEIDLGPLGRVR
jgi:hypothetical protein